MSDVIHLAKEDLESGNETHCGLFKSWQSGAATHVVVHVTCMRCLEVGQADAEERAAQCIMRIIDLAMPPAPTGYPRVVGPIRYTMPIQNGVAKLPDDSE